MEISFHDGKIEFSIGKREPTIRAGKGHSKLDLVSSYVAIDIETTGLDPLFDDIIELGAVRIQNGEEVDVFNALVNPGYDIDPFIIDLTGITNEMLNGALPISKVLPLFLEFAGNELLIGHNVNFDINFIFDACKNNNHSVFF